MGKSIADIKKGLMAGGLAALVVSTGCGHINKNKVSHDKPLTFSGEVLKDHTEIYGGKNSAEYTPWFSLGGEGGTRFPDGNYILTIKADNGRIRTFHWYGLSEQVENMDEKVNPGDRVTVTLGYKDKPKLDERTCNSITKH